MTSRPDSIAERRAELERRLASLSPEQRARLAVGKAGAALVVEERRTIPARDPDAPIPMSFAQELLWRLERANPGHNYHVPRSVRLRGALDLGALQRALDALVVRHEALRTTFALVQDEPRQIVNAPVPVPIERVELSGLSEAEKEPAARRRMKELASMTFDLETDLQLRAAVIRLDEEDHILQLVSHHVASDGWSGNVLVRELAALYEGFRTGVPVELPPLPVQFADYAVWQRRELSGTRLDALLEYWHTRLEGAPSQIDLPTDRAKAAAPASEGAVCATTLPLSIVEGIRALTASQGVTSFMVLLSALYVVLARHSGEEEIIVGTPIAGRSYPELEGIVGFFTNTLLLRGSLAGNPTFRELLERVRGICLGAYDHQDIPLETLLLAKGTNGRPLATMPQVVLSTEDPQRERLRLAGTASTAIAASLGGTKFDLTLWAAERPEGLQVAAEFRTDLFDDATISRLLRHYGVLLQSAVASPDTRIGDISMIDEAERRQVLVGWNDTHAAYPEHATIHGLIEAQVRRRPEAVAVECTVDGVFTSLTYRELDRRANRVAWTLRKAGVAADHRVGVCLDRTVNTVVAILGVLKSGGAYLPIDPAYPDDRIVFTVRDAGATLMLTDGANRARLADLFSGTTTLDVDDAVRAGSSDDAPPVVVSPRDMAYVIYTSGSTGRPKGCMIEHRNVTRLLVNDRSLFDFNEHDVWTIFHSFAFDFSVWEMFGALVFGGRAVVVPRAVAQNATEFLALLERTGTTILNQVPSAFQPLMDEAVALRPALKVRYVIFGGEALKPALLRKWRAFRPEARLVNMFGITETTVHVTYKEIGEAEITAGVSNIGRPIPTTTLYVLDHALRPVPIGIAGELCVGGLGVARGYLNRPELSAERFVPNPFESGAASLLYRSGDLGRQLPNGEIEYIGRRDHQVKIRGHRIELGEIEAALLTQAGVAEAVVMVREDTPGDQRLAAYVVAETEAFLTIPALRDQMRERLPEVMVPTAFEFLDRLPLTSNGKVDLRALPVPHGAVGGPPYAPPRTTIECEIIQIWEKLLSPGRPIGAHDEFFELGGHSLLAMQMLAEIERVRGQRVPLAWLFESSTVRSLGEKLGAKLLDAKEPPLVVLQEHGTDGPVVFVHGDWTGGGWYARRLAPLVAPQSPFFVLPTIGADGEQSAWTIESMAARHLEELRKVQPRGPYRIVGFCVGGMIAFEIARQLLAAGDVVERLVVIDSDPINARLQAARGVLALLPPGNADTRLSRAASMMSRLRWVDKRVRHVGAMTVGGQLRWIRERLTNRLPMLVGRSRQPVGASATPIVTDGEEEIVLRIQQRATSVFIPRRFDGTIDLVWARGAPDKAPRSNPLERWQLVAGNVRMHALPSSHIGLITNNLSMLATALRVAFESDHATPNTQVVGEPLVQG